MNRQPHQPSTFNRANPTNNQVYLDGCEQVSDSGVTALSDRCADLKFLDLRGCPLVTSTAISALRASHEGIRLPER